MLRTKNLLPSSALVEELNDQVSEKFSGGANFEIDIPGLEGISSLLDLEFLGRLSNKIKSLVPDIEQKKNLSVLCVNNKCTATVDGKTLKFIV